MHGGLWHQCHAEHLKHCGPTAAQDAEAESCWTLVHASSSALAFRRTEDRPSLPTQNHTPVLTAQGALLPAANHIKQDAVMRFMPAAQR